MADVRRYVAGDQVIHGAYCNLAAVDLVSHFYAGSGGDGPSGYVEVLEFPAPPEGRAKCVVHDFLEGVHTIMDFDTLEGALEAQKLVWWGVERNLDKIMAIAGFRQIHSEVWFYQPNPA